MIALMVVMIFMTNIRGLVIYVFYCHCINSHSEFI